MKLYKSQLLGATMDLSLKRIYFWGGIFSQWAECKIHDTILDITFNCAEQAMMYHKARIFKDDEACQKIIGETDPRVQKALGRSIKNYVEDVWADCRFDIVKRINFLKFWQNPAWRELLVFTDGYEIVEASPYDKIWGVGLGEDDPLILDKTNWNGMNLLGKAIMDARAKIIETYEYKIDS